MIGQFKQKSPANIILLLILGMLIKAPLFLYPRPVQVAATDGVLYTQFVAPYLKGTSAFGIADLTFGLLYLQALLINYVVNAYRLTGRQTYLPAMAYLLLTSLWPEWNYFSAPLLANTFIIWAFIQLFKVYNAPAARETIYNTGLIVGLCAFIFFPVLFITLCMLLGIMILRPFRLNELFLLLLGVLTPFYFYGAYLFLNDSLQIRHILPALYLQVPIIKSLLWLIVAVVLLVIPFLTGGYYVQMHLPKMLIQVRKNWGILFIYLLLTVLIPFMNTASFHNWIVAAVPFAVFHSAAYFYLKNKWVPLCFFFITIAAILIQQYATPIWH